MRLKLLSVFCQGMLHGDAVGGVMLVGVVMFARPDSFDVPFFRVTAVCNGVTRFRRSTHTPSRRSCHSVPRSVDEKKNQYFFACTLSRHEFRSPAKRP